MFPILDLRGRLERPSRCFGDVVNDNCERELENGGFPPNLREETVDYFKS